MTAREKFIKAYSDWIEAKNHPNWSWGAIEYAWALYCEARDEWTGSSLVMRNFN